MEKNTRNAELKVILLINEVEARVKEAKGSDLPNWVNEQLEMALHGCKKLKKAVKEWIIEGD